MPRMADFAVWTTAAEDALRWQPATFMAAYTGNRDEATENALEADLVAGAIRQFMAKRDALGDAGAVLQQGYRLLLRAGWWRGGG
jgi:hypothetical protein